jgi:hypothetical protein
MTYRTAALVILAGLLVVIPACAAKVRPVIVTEPLVAEPLLEIPSDDLECAIDAEGNLSCVKKKEPIAPGVLVA